jgi:hypothetical protein
VRGNGGLSCRGRGGKAHKGERRQQTDKEVIQKVVSRLRRENVQESVVCC